MYTFDMEKKKYPLLTFRISTEDQAKEISILLDRAVADLNAKSIRGKRITKAEIIYQALKTRIPKLKVSDFE